MQTPHSINDLAWPAERLGEALEALGKCGRLGATNVQLEAPPPEVVEDADRFDRWMHVAADCLGLEVEPVEAAYADVHQLLQRAGPALLRLPQTRFLALAGGKRKHLALLTPEQSMVHVDPEAVRAAVCQPVEGPVARDIDAILVRAGVQSNPRAHAALMAELLAGTRIGGCWLLRSAPAADLWRLAREARLASLVAGLIAADVVGNALMVLSWLLLGWAAFGGHFEAAWLVAWLLVIVGMISCRLLQTSCGGLFAIRAGALLKRRLLSGALKMEPDTVRRQGAGQLLGQVIESEVVEGMAISSGLLGVTAVIELVMAIGVLSAGAAPLLQVLLFLAWLVVTVLVCVRYYRRCRRWTAARSGMTNDLVECMIGHRTRLAQQPRQDWHQGEDAALEDYLILSRDMDRTAVAIQTLSPRGWFIVGLLGLAPAFVAGDHSATALAISVGGMLMAYRAFGSLSQGLGHLGSAAIAWERIKPMWKAAATHEPIGDPRYATAVSRDSSGAATAPLLDGRGLVFRYPGRSTPVLQGVDVSVHAGDRLLLAGPSGGGKSTLAAVLAGARQSDAGLLLFQGLDLQTLGAEGWRGRVVIVPQFHENHVLIGTFAFNLLMGRRWPPEPGDLQEAEAICRALDLGPLLDRMPGGLQQMVGETGWQLSQGEKSRLYMARALLQRADIVIFDESFGALDPQTLRTSLDLVLRSVPTVLVIAHP